MILCLGTTPVFQRTMIFERLAVDRVNRAKVVHDYASGKSVNAARVIQTLGGEVLASGFAGGVRGQLLCRDLDQAAVRHDFVTVASQTRQCITLIDRAGGSATELVEESAAIEEEGWRRLEEKLHLLLPRARVWVFSGTLAPGAPQNFYARWLPLARQTGSIAIVDARDEPLRLALQQPNGTLKMNRDELAATLQEDLRDDERLVGVMRRLAPPAGRIIVTLGAAGALACEGSTCWRVIPPKVTAVSAVGSGDAFAGGLAVALHDGAAFPEALRLACACGAANALAPLAGHVDKAEVERLMPQVRVEPT